MTITNETARVDFTKIHIDLYQPAKKGEGGIWAVESWFDENNRQWQVRDLSKLQPLFYNDDNVPDEIREAVVSEWTKAFGVYYNVLGFEARNVQYTIKDDLAELKFTLTIITQNFYKDPDTVEYIIKARESGLWYYERLYDEYNMARSGNVELLVTFELTQDGEPLPDTILVYGNVSPVGEEYVPVKATDYILSSDTVQTYTKDNHNITVESTTENTTINGKDCVLQVAVIDLDGDGLGERVTAYFTCEYILEINDEVPKNYYDICEIIITNADGELYMTKWSYDDMTSQIKAFRYFVGVGTLTATTNAPQNK